MFFLMGSLSGLLLLTSCHASHQVISIKGGLIVVDSTYDEQPDADAMALINPYKRQIDSTMNVLLGEADTTMRVERPESLLSNLVADVLKESAVKVQGVPADMGLVNMGGLRNILSAGPITCRMIYEILPFDNSLCLVSIKGTVLQQLFEAIAARKGEGVSGVQLTITEAGKLLQGSIGGAPVDPDRVYTVATVDYLADGNDGMAPLAQSVKRVCPDGATLRDLFLDYVTRQTQAGKRVTSQLDGRVQLGRE